MTSFELMSELLRLVWPSVSKIDWAHFTPNSAMSYDIYGVPKYSGLLMHRAGGGCIGASTTVVGFLPRPEKSATTATRKTELLKAYPNILSSMEKRNPANDDWGGGIKVTTQRGISYAITGFPEIGDHLLLANMMLVCKLLSHDNYHQVVNPHSKTISPVITAVGMSVEIFNKLNHNLVEIVRLAMTKIDTDNHQ